MAYYSMSTIQFCTNPRGDLPHYSYVFRKPEPLGTDIKNVACSRLGTMLYLDIQKGEGTTKMAEYQQRIGGTSACMKRLTMATKVCEQLT